MSERTVTKKLPELSEAKKEMMSARDALLLYSHDYNEMNQVMCPRIQHYISKIIELQAHRQKLCSLINARCMDFANRKLESTLEEQKSFFSEIRRLEEEYIAYSDCCVKIMDTIYGLCQEKKHQLEIGYKFTMQRMEPLMVKEEPTDHDSDNRGSRELVTGKSKPMTTSTTAAPIRRSSTRRSSTRSPLKTANTDSEKSSHIAVKSELNGRLRSRLNKVKEEFFCLCHEVSYGEMICCDNGECSIKWFHFPCVYLERTPKGNWYCPNCRGERSNVLR